MGVFDDKKIPPKDWKPQQFGIARKMPTAVAKPKPPPPIAVKPLSPKPKTSNQ